MGSVPVLKQKAVLEAAALSGRYLHDLIVQDDRIVRRGGL